MKKKQVFLGILPFLIAVITSTFVSAACGTLNGDYTMSGNEITVGDCFTIGTNSITLNCAGYSITGLNTGAGIKMNGRSSVVIKNCDIKNFDTGINISNSNAVTVNNTNISSVNIGIFIDPSAGTRLKDIAVTDGNIGFKLEKSNDAVLQDVAATSCDIGLDIGLASSGNAFSQCDFSGNTVDVQNLGLASVFTDVRCITGINVECREDVPFFSNFNNGVTTNFATVPNLASVIGATLTDNSGMIVFTGLARDFRGLNLNDNLIIEDNFVSLDSEALSALDGPAKVTLMADCSNYRIYTKTGAPGSYDEIVGAKTVCTSCVVDSCISGFLTFDVTGFSGYASGPGTNLTVWDDTDALARYADEQVFFFANYSNATSNAPITGASCNVTFQLAPVGPFAMAYNATSKFYEYNRTFSAPGTSDWDVNCSAAGYANLKAADTVTISSLLGNGVPEFSAYTLLLAIVISVSGFMIIRNRVC
ncbi:MAG: hypothetical protein NTW67_05560 [Candidatus Woesearchaeota archaeon]|nr:hypothetical protein [Candidatus Woesearchaeota archaeon]